MNNNKNCTYCHKPLGKKYSFSYGITGIPRVYGCSRLFCRIMVKFRRKRNNFLKLVAMKLHNFTANLKHNKEGV